MKKFIVKTDAPRHEAKNQAATCGLVWNVLDCRQGVVFLELSGGSPAQIDRFVGDLKAAGYVAEIAA